MKIIDSDTLEEIVWDDASKQNINIDELEVRTPKKLLSKISTYGRVYSIDDYAITVISSEDPEKMDDVEIYTIPRSWIITPKKYSSKKKCCSGYLRHIKDSEGDY